MCSDRQNMSLSLAFTVPKVTYDLPVNCLSLITLEYDVYFIYSFFLHFSVLKVTITGCVLVTEILVGSVNCLTGGDCEIKKKSKKWQCHTKVRCTVIVCDYFVCN
jgi:hypothetical protein